MFCRLIFLLCLITPPQPALHQVAVLQDASGTEAQSPRAFSPADDRLLVSADTLIPSAEMRPVSPSVVTVSFFRPTGTRAKLLCSRLRTAQRLCGSASINRTSSLCSSVPMVILLFRQVMTRSTFGISGAAHTSRNWMRSRGSYPIMANDS